MTDNTRETYTENYHRRSTKHVYQGRFWGASVPQTLDRPRFLCLRSLCCTGGIMFLPCPSRLPSRAECISFTSQEY